MIRRRKQICFSADGLNEIVDLTAIHTVKEFADNERRKKLLT